MIRYRPDIDGLRAVAVLGVVLHHLSTSLAPGGYVGVDVFFVISGYLITGIIHSDLEQGNFTFARFYERRVRRIFPALLVMLCVCLAVGYGLLFPTDMSAMLRGALGTLLFASNMVFWRDLSAGYFAATDAMQNPLLHTWSLGVEEQFYLAFPVALLAIRRLCARWLPHILYAGAIISLGLAALLLHSKSVAVFFLSPFRAWELLAGALLTVGGIPPISSQTRRECVAWLGFVAVASSIVLYTPKTPFPGLAAVMPVLGACAIIHAGGNTSVGRLLAARPIVYIGLISYSLYLWHWPVIVFARHYLVGEAMHDYVVLLGAVSVLIGSLSYHLVEQPFRGRKLSYARTVVPASIVTVSVLASTAVIGIIHDGFAGRFSTQIVQYDKERTPLIPFVQCDEKTAGDWCKLGSEALPPKTLLWGDSHLIAWAPAIQNWFQQTGRSAYLAATSACPPLFGVGTRTKPNCISQNEGVRLFLSKHPEIRTVAMIARWEAYFGADASLTTANGKGKDMGTLAQDQLAYTLHSLRDQGLRVILFGPVPSHSMSVPLALARNRYDLIHDTAGDEYRRNASFYASVENARRVADFEFLDPVQHMCTPDCLVTQSGVSLYRDSHHLSVSGAMHLAPLIQDLFPARSETTRPPRTM
jgi:peptidoglycan/LPS O-acetylase OafA/YrhL